MQTLEQTKLLDSACNKIQHLPGIRFVGVINKMGKLVAGGFKKDIIPYVEEETNRTVYMQLCLEVSMRKEFDDLLGSLEYIAARRKKVTMISIPYEPHIVIISAEPFADAEKIATTSIELFQEMINR